MKSIFERSILTAVCFASLVLGARGQTSHVGDRTGRADNGLDGFKRYCAGCHGIRGDGTGTFAPYLDPKPRDMTAGIYKCRSTPTGSLPTDQDLYDTMVRGLVTSAMPPWAALTPQQRVDFVAYIKKFSPRFGSEAAAVPIVIPTETPVTIEGLRHGSELYQKLSCARCHGVSGIGDGPDAPTLINFKHQPDPPYDFTITSRFKCGQSNADLYKVLMTGMDGTPMLSFAGKMEPGEAWDLVHYLRTLEVSRKGKENEVLRAAGGRKALASGAPVAP